MSSMAIPLATRLPTKGGGNSGLSSATPGARAGSGSPRARASVGGLLAQLALAGPEVAAADGACRTRGRPRPVLLSSTSRSMVRRPSKASLP